MAESEKPVALIDSGQPRKIPTIYADVVSAAGLAPFVSKITFSLTAGEADAGKQAVSPVVDIAMPTASLIEFCSNFLRHAAGNADALIGMNQNVTQLLEKLKAQQP